jgi:hypothetical protein
MGMNNLGTLAIARREDCRSEQKNALHLRGKLGKKLTAWPWPLSPSTSRPTHCPST